MHCSVVVKSYLLTMCEALAKNLSHSQTYGASPTI